MTMRIKLHNSLAKTNSKYEFIWNERIYFTYADSCIKFSYTIQDWQEFLSFNTITKELKPVNGFGSKQKFLDLTWWRNTSIMWYEMNDEMRKFNNEN